MIPNHTSHVQLEALRLAQLGYHVFPCRQNKQPLTPRGFHDATTDPDQIAKWFSKWPGSNLGIATEGLLIVDLDPGNPWAGDPDREGLLIGTCGTFSKTPRGGFHFFFSRPEGATWKCSAGQLAQGVDVRTDGGYVLLPPSRTNAGGYSWSDTYGPLSVPVAELPNPPAWLVKLLNCKPKKSNGTTTSAGDRIPEGQRNTRLAKMAGSMRRQGATPEAIRAALGAVNAAQCDPPLEDAELDAIAKSVGRYEPKPEDAAAGPRPSPNGQHAPPPQRPVFEFISSDAFAAGDYRPEWLIPGILVRRQPGTIAGPGKAMKTSIMLDAAISLASGTAFLGKFDVPHSVRVAVASGESGEHTIQETAARICRARGLNLADLRDRLNWCFKLPKFADPVLMTQFAEELCKLQAEVSFIDPLYLSLGDIDPRNMFEMGEALRPVGEKLLAIACTPIIAHHANRLLPLGEPMELSHLAYSGLEQWVRQWVLINRRERYQFDGRHDLWVGIGGSAGHGGMWSVRIEEGLTDASFGGRYWDVAAEAASQARQQERERKDREKKNSKDATLAKLELDFCRKLDELDRDRKGYGVRQLRDVLAWSAETMTRIINRLQANGIVEHCSIRTPIGSNATRDAQGVRRKYDAQE